MLLTELRPGDLWIENRQGELVLEVTLDNSIIVSWLILWSDEKIYNRSYRTEFGLMSNGTKLDVFAPVEIIREGKTIFKKDVLECNI